ncbi:unnamed protein product [Lathyrus sativus]|nr:unnamed protein product [Lathyrus sativus]
MKWYREGDVNSKYFHKLINGRARKKFIGVVETSQGTVDSVEGVKEVVHKFFKLKFTEVGVERPGLEGTFLKSLSESDVIFLERPFSEENFKLAVWSCRGDKSPGPNGYNCVFEKLLVFYEVGNLNSCEGLPSSSFSS